MVTAMTDQWTLNRLNFEGCWQGRSEWFGRDGTGALDLVAPQRVIDPTTYSISFSNPDTGVGDGSGLFFAPGGQPPMPPAAAATTPAVAAGSSLGRVASPA